MSSDYFSDQVNTGQPIMPPTPAQAPVVPQAPVNPSVDQATAPIDGQWMGLPVRAAGDRIFLLKGGKRQWVTSPEVYTKLGFKFGDESKIDQATLDVLPEGEPLR